MLEYVGFDLINQFTLRYIKSQKFGLYLLQSKFYKLHLLSSSLFVIDNPHCHVISKYHHTQSSNSNGVQEQKVRMCNVQCECKEVVLNNMELPDINTCPQLISFYRIKRLMKTHL